MKRLLQLAGWTDRHGNLDKEEIKIDLIVIGMAVFVAVLAIVYA